MQLIVSDLNPALAAMLDGYEVPAILVTANYRVLAANALYENQFGALSLREAPRCYQVSHGYDRPCDQAGEDCPLALTLNSGRKERVLHIHQTPRGREHVDVELVPIHDATGTLKYFVELLRPVNLASPQADDCHHHQMVGKSLAFNRLVRDITRVGPADAAVLLWGESGTGKELAALAVHRASARRHKAMVTLECAGLTETLFESELFGHVKGAFTGAVNHKQGLAEAANGGTLFLDEIGDVPLELQVKLLRLLETGAYRPVGSNQALRTDFRLICATHKDLRTLVAEGRFRQDLYYRINVFPIRLPTLRERIEDLPLLVDTMLRRLYPDYGYTCTESALALLRQQHFHGNVRELRNLLARAAVLSNTNVIDQQVITECLSIDSRDAHPAPTLEEPFVGLREQEQRYLRRLLVYCGGDKEKAAATAGISVRSLYRKLQDGE
ncbi:MAG: sigma-54-dependent Fis family transcriptional regulator [Pseudomonadales bacterium]|nr:sigma-54-dependent Fis family transcriptional regulator [Pseudomonadales bacterium]